MTYHLLFAALAVAMTASTLLTQGGSQQRAPQRVFAISHGDSGRSLHPGFSGAFGSSAAVRNLLY